MNVTVIGAGNSGLAMAAHLSKEGNKVTLWNRSAATISKLIKTKTIYFEGVISGSVRIHCVTHDIKKALESPDIILITTPASSHKELARLIAANLSKTTVILLNPGRTFGAIEFETEFRNVNSKNHQIIAESQTIIYTCRKTSEDSVHIITFKESVLISSIDKVDIVQLLPEAMRLFFKEANTMIETSIGNVGMILHCAPLLFNIGWTESSENQYNYYYDGITPTIAKYLEKIDNERVSVAEKMGHELESTKDWLLRTYNTNGNDLYECIQNNEAYKNINAPKSLYHRYLFEDLPCGLVPLESLGLKLGLDMSYTTLIIDLANKIIDYDFRTNGRTIDKFKYSYEELIKVITRKVKKYE